MDQEIIEKLKAEHGEVHILEADGVEIAVRMPSMPEFDRFMASAADSKRAGSGLRQLVRDVIVHPSVKEFDAIVARRPGIFMPFGQAVSQIAGATVEAQAKKA